MSEQDNKITIDLNIFDDEGNIVDGTTSDLTLNQISDIIDHAAQLILMHRAGQDISEILDNLDEALTVSDVLNDENEIQPPAPRPF